MKAIIPAAGLGTRFLPATKSVPKELLPVLDKPVLQYVVEEALAAPHCDKVVVVKSPAKALIEDYFQRKLSLEKELKERGKDSYAQAIEEAGKLPLDFVDQHEALGLGHAVHCAEYHCKDEAFYVLLGDVIAPDKDILPRLYEVSQAHNQASVIAVVPVRDDEIERFGIIGGQEISPGVYKISKLVEKPKKEEAPSNLAIFGRYLLSPRLMELLAHTKKGAGDEIQLTDALIELLEHEEIYAVCIDKDAGYDTGTIPNWIATNLAMALKDERYAQDLKDLLGKEL